MSNNQLSILTSGKVIKIFNEFDEKLKNIIVNHVDINIGDFKYLLNLVEHPLIGFMNVALVAVESNNTKIIEFLIESGIDIQTLYCMIKDSNFEKMTNNAQQIVINAVTTSHEKLSIINYQMFFDIYSSFKGEIPKAIYDSLVIINRSIVIEGLSVKKLFLISRYLDGDSYKKLFKAATEKSSNYSLGSNDYSLDGIFNMVYEHMFYCCNKNSNTQKKINHENIKSKDYTQVQLEEMVYKLFNNNLTKFHYLFYWMSDEDVNEIIDGINFNVGAPEDDLNLLLF